MAAEYQSGELLASARISGTAGKVLFATRFFGGCTRVSDGVYDMTILTGVTFAEQIPDVSFLSTDSEAGWSSSFELIDDHTVRVRTLAGGALADADFFFRLERVRVGQLPTSSLPVPPPVPNPPIAGLTGQARRIVQPGASPFAFLFADFGMADMPDANYVVELSGETNATIQEGTEATTGFTIIGGLPRDVMHILVTEPTI